MHTPRDEAVTLFREALKRFMPGYSTAKRAAMKMNREDTLAALDELHGIPDDADNLSDYMLTAELLLQIREEYFIPIQNWAHYPDYE